MVMSDVVGELPTKEEFSGQVDSVFRARVGDEGPAFDVRLVQFDEHVSNAVQENYSLLFRAPTDAPATQNVFRLEHKDLGQLDLFLVPVKKDENGLYYEAVFNRFIGQ